VRLVRGLRREERIEVVGMIEKGRKVLFMVSVVEDTGEAVYREVHCLLACPIRQCHWQCRDRPTHYRLVIVEVLSVTFDRQTHRQGRRSTRHTLPVQLSYYH
jgi:hypothetical protein